MRKWLKYINIIFLLVVAMSMTKKVSADTLFKGGQIVKRGNVDLDTFDDATLYNFNYDGNSVYLTYIEVTLNRLVYTSEKSLVKLAIRDNDEWIYDGDIESETTGQDTWACIYAGNERLKYGHSYGITIENTGMGRDYKVYYQIEKYNNYTQNVKIPSGMNLKIGDYKSLNFQSISPYGSLLEIKWKTSNSKVATVDELGYVTAIGKGSCNIEGTLRNGNKVRCSVSVSVPAPYINYTKYTLNKGQGVKLKVCYSNKKVKWSSSNKKVATVSSSGKVVAKGIGKCTITAKIGKKKYKCKITVSYREANFGAVLSSYNTRNNYFVVKFKNWGNKPVYIKPGNAKVQNTDYKSFDRYLRLAGGKTIKVNPHKSVSVKFYVRGRVSWYDVSTYTLFYRFSYDGRSFEGHVWDEDSVYKKGKKWYATYWNSYETIYSNWR